MVEYFPGDTVVCKIGFGKIVASDDYEFEQTHPFDIVCSCDNGYLILIPRDVYLKNSFTLYKKECAEFGLPHKFLGGTVHFIANKHVVSVRAKLSGLPCAKCHEHFEYAEVNRLDENGKGILICWRCRTYPHYR